MIGEEGGDEFENIGEGNPNDVMVTVVDGDVEGDVGFGKIAEV